MNDRQLNLVFAALSDATRRGMLARLSNGETNISTLAAPYKMSQPAISKHMRVLESAGLIIRTRNGREHLIRIAPAPAREAQDWIAYYTRHWISRFDEVDAYLAKNDLKNVEN